MKKIIAIFICIMLTVTSLNYTTKNKVVAGEAAVAYERTKTKLADDWKFQLSDSLDGADAMNYDDSSWDNVSVPHTWNSVYNWDTHKACWYRKTVTVDKNQQGNNVYFYFEGVGTIADVYVNGHYIGEHRGAYTAFIMDATDYINFGGDNVLAVKVNNDDADSTDCLPSDTEGYSKKYQIYGGIYRNTWMITTSDYSIDPTDYASSGVYVTQTNVSTDSADVSIKTKLLNSASTDKEYTITNKILDKDSNVVKTLTSIKTVKAGEKSDVTAKDTVTNPNLWSKANPYLYKVVTELTVDGVVTDKVEENIGFRNFAWDKDNNKFKLNGEDVSIRGVSYHQETENRAGVLTKDDYDNFFNTIEDMGLNAVRLAHYPRAGYEYDLADERGLITWAENGNSVGADWSQTGENITKELIRQNYNHPSIMFWGIGNETFQEGGVDASNKYATTAKEEDPNRIITEATDDKVTNADIISRNDYTGWYWGGDPWEFSDFVSKTDVNNHYISEIGAGSVITNHQDYSKRNKDVDRFEPMEYRQYFDEAIFQTSFVDKKSDVPLFFYWNLTDFANTKYKNQNTKGIITLGGYKKDPYYLYKAFMRKDVDVLRICSPEWYVRNEGNAIKVYSNADTVTLKVNGTEVSTLNNGEYKNNGTNTVDNVFFWKDVLYKGKNEIEVSDSKGGTEKTTIYYTGDATNASEDTEALVTNLTTDNSSNPAQFIDMKVKANWPVYYQCDGKADNTLAEIPEELKDAKWIATKRQSDNAYTTNMKFKINSNVSKADVYIMTSDNGVDNKWITVKGFEDTGITGQWRDNSLNLENYRLYKKEVDGGSTVEVGSAVTDFVVLVKEHTTDTQNVENIRQIRLEGTAFTDENITETTNNTYDKAVDGALNTYYSSDSDNDGYVGLDFGKAKDISQIKFAPRGNGRYDSKTYESKMKGGKFQGSNTSPTSGYTDIYTINTQPAIGWNTIKLTGTNKYRYIRYVGANGTNCMIADMDVYTEDQSEAEVSRMAMWYNSFDNNLGMSGSLNSTISFDNDKTDDKDNACKLVSNLSSGDTNANPLSITPEDTETFDATGYNYLIFDLLDTNGSNSFHLKLSDGQFTWESWVNSAKVVKDQWTKVVVPLKNITSNLRLNQITRIAISEYNKGTYYINDVYFAQNISDEKPTRTTVVKGKTLDFQNFDKGNGATATSNSSVSFKEGTIVQNEGNQYTKLDVSSSGWPGASDRSVKVTADNNASINASGYKFLSFYANDTVNNTGNYYVTVTDKDGKTYKEWTEKAVKNVWSRINISLDAVKDTIDISSIKEVTIGSYNEGTYYIDNVFFSNDTYTEPIANKEEETTTQPITTQPTTTQPTTTQPTTTQPTTQVETTNKQQITTTNNQSVTTKKVIAKPGKAKVSKLLNQKGKKVKISLKKIKGAKGYQIKYSLTKKMKKSKYLLTKKVTIIIKKMRRGKTYYFAVRAYNFNGTKKNYGAWSTIKKVKIKK